MDGERKQWRIVPLTLGATVRDTMWKLPEFFYLISMNAAFVNSSKSLTTKAAHVPSIHHLGGSELCPVSTLADLHALVKESDKIITF